MAGVLSEPILLIMRPRSNAIPIRNESRSSGLITWGKTLGDVRVTVPSFGAG